MTMMLSTRRVLLGAQTKWQTPDLAGATMTPGMAKRLPPAGPFAAAPIIQGKWDGTGIGDSLRFPRGNQIGNLTGYAYANFDPYQGTITLWLTPEWAGNDGKEHTILWSDAALEFRKTAGSVLKLVIGGQTYAVVSTATWTAGTTYHVVVSWDSKRTIDGTNYVRVSVNNAHTYGITTQPTITAAPLVNLYLGPGGSAPDALIQGLVISRRVWTDSNGYGDSIGNGADEIGQVYAAGAGKDWATINGSWDTQASLPTDSAVGALVTSATQMWHHPIEASVPDVTMCRDGGYLGSPFAVEMNGTNAYIDCGSGATLDDLGAGGATFQVEFWFRADSASGATSALIGKGYPGLGGWNITLASNDRLQANIDLVTTDSAPYSLATPTRDGKWHHGVLSYNDTTRGGYVALDGVWGAVSTGVGNYQTDVANSLYMGRRSTAAANYHLGAIGWSRIWNAAHYTPGTDFIPPRTFSSVGSVEAWAANEGTGATLTASITAPANNGTLTNCTWSGVWAPQATPIVPTSLQCDGAATYGNAGLGGSIDNLADAEFTVDGWIRSPGNGTTEQMLIMKGSWASNRGWAVYFNGAGVPNFYVKCATTSSTATWGSAIKDDRWHSFSAHFNDAGGADRKCRLSVDGLTPIVGSLAVGAIVADAADNLIIGVTEVPSKYWKGGISWLRISNNDRNNMVAGPGVKAFCPIDRVNPPAADANTLWQVNFTTGAGLLEQNVVLPGTNDCVITMGAGKWLNTPDMATDAPGERVFNWGYKFGSSAAGDGLTIRDIGVTASQDYVVRVVTHADPRSQPYLQFWDMIGAAQIGANYYLPRRYGQHTGANNSATLICATGYFWQQLVGWRVYNITDGSWTTITAVSGDRTTITGVLAGGTDNDWDTNDYYMLMPPVGKHESQYPYATETIHVICTPVGCTSMEMRLINNSTGVMGLHQFEVQPSLLINGDHETLTGADPNIITGWLSGALHAGDTEAEATVVHGGIQSVQWNPGASSGQMTYSLALAAVGSYVCLATWLYGEPFSSRAANAANALLHYSTSAYALTSLTGAFWKHVPGVWRIVFNPPSFGLSAWPPAAAAVYTDDIYAFALTPITLTVTPASAVNSAEGTGIRVDGFDLLTNPAAVFQTASSIHIRARYIPRHEIALAAGFGDATEYLFDLREDANNYIQARREANVLRLSYNANGGGLVTAVGNIAGLWAANVENTVQVVMNPGAATLTFNGVAVVTLAGATFATAFTQPIAWGSSYLGANAFDGVVK